VIDHRALHLAARARALTVEVVTTGATTLAATATGYTRSAGSFLDDGFAVGMEVTASGFGTAANNGTGVIDAVSALAMSVTPYTVTADSSANGYTVTARTLVAENAASGRTLAVGLPALRAYENVRFAPVTDRPYVEEEYLPGGAPFKATLGAFGELEVRPSYVLRCYGPDGTGLSALRRLTDALTTHFAPNTPLTVGSDTALVRSDTGPFPSPLQRTDDGWAVITLTIPLRLRTRNSR